MVQVWAGGLQIKVKYLVTAVPLVPARSTVCMAGLVQLLSFELKETVNKS